MDKDFGALLGVNASLAGISLAAYAILLTISNSGSPGVTGFHFLTIGKIFFSWCVPIFLVGTWLMIVQRAADQGCSRWDLFLASGYTSIFWGILLFLIGYMFLIVA